MVESGHESREDWEARDLRSAVAKVYGAAKDKHTLSLRVVIAWAVAIGLIAALDFLGLATSASMYWTAFAAVAGALLAATAYSRSPVPLLLACILVILDIAFVVNRLPATVQHKHTGDLVVSGIRIGLAPLALYALASGYMGALSIQAFKRGFSPAADWRGRVNRVTLNFAIVVVCLASAGVGFVTWYRNVMSGEAVMVAEPPPMTAEQRMDAQAKKRKALREKLELIMPGGGPKPPVQESDGPPPIPESARPVFAKKGLDTYARREVDDAWEWVEDNEADEAGCMVEALGRQDRCRDNRCRYWARFFGRACLVKARKSVDFCKDVPDPTALLAGFEWAESLCAGRDFETCREAYWAVQGHCHLTKEEVEALPPPPPPALPER